MVGKVIFRVMCGDGRQLPTHNCEEPSESRDAWSWVTARLLQTKLRAVAKSYRGKLDEFQHRFCDDQDPCTGEDTDALGRVLIEDRPVPTFPLSMWNPASYLQDLAAEVALAKHASDGRYIMLI